MNSKRQPRLDAYPHIPEYPTAQKFETPAGPVIIEDPYAWLRLHDSDKEVGDVIAAQNKLTDSYLEQIGNTEAIYNRLEELSNSTTKYTIPDFYDNFITWAQRSPDQQRWTMMRMRHDSTEAEVIIDPNTLEEGLTLSRLGYDANETKYLYTLQKNGDETSRAFIHNTETGETTHFHTGRVFEYSWDSEGDGFTYVKSVHEEHGSDNNSEYQKVFHHSEEGDVLIFDPVDYDLPANTWMSAERSGDDSHTLVTAWLGKRDIRHYVIDNETMEATPLFEEARAAHRGRFLDGFLYFTTNHEANNTKVIRMPIDEAHKPIEEWEEFLPERPDEQFQDLSFTKDYAIVEYTKNTASTVEIRDRHTGEFIQFLDMPELSNIARISTSTSRSDFFYSISNCLTFETAYHFSDGQSDKMWEDSRSMDPEKVQATQEWCELPDGSMQPMLIVAPKDGLRDTPRPVWFEGYGGFALGRYPKDFYNSMRRIWVEAGGVVVDPCMPGGNEFGDDWHAKALGPNRQISFDGMISAIEHSLATGISVPEQVALSGGSNGGLMALVIAMQRPEIVRVVNSRVPLSDMYDYPNHLIGSIWTSEFGDPRKAEEFDWLAYSPYHTFDSEGQYPSMLISASEHDTRVHPVHAYKMTARMQTGASHNPVLLRSDSESGHGSGKGVSHRLRMQAERLSFMMHEVGLEFNSPN